MLSTEGTSPATLRRSREDVWGELLTEEQEELGLVLLSSLKELGLEATIEAAELIGIGCGAGLAGMRVIVGEGGAKEDIGEIINGLGEAERLFGETWDVGIDGAESPWVAQYLTPPIAVIGLERI